MYMPHAKIHLLAIVSWLSVAGAIPLDVNDDASIKQAASTIAYGLMTYYTGNQSSSPVAEGTFPAPYYWWEAGAAWGAMIEYWHYTSDSTYNDVVTQALLSQISSTEDFMPPAEEGQEGNDDQFFWGAAAMSAAEYNFSSPSAPASRWLALAAAVFNDQVLRWNTATCAGGLKWQIYPSNTGYDYKNTAANGGFFQLAARLARYTGNATYVEWATTTWDWMAGVGLVDAQYAVYDGTQDGQNCSQVNELSFSYTHGMLLYGCAALANATNGSAPWTGRATGLLAATTRFFTPFPNASLVMFEPACEPQASCNADQLSFKAYLARWLAASAQLVPDLTAAITTLLQHSAQAAAAACAGGARGDTCGQKWYVGGFDGSVGVGQQLGALEVVQGLLAQQRSPPNVTAAVHISVVAATTTAPVPTATPQPKPALGGGGPLGGAGRAVPGPWVLLGLGLLGAVLAP
ncbi:hydrolase 76 protein [Xylographa bjoerkii]|nr:hydrolase 76 protein [Xylographa bjoerkii]